MESARQVTEDITILPSYFPIPGFGLVPVNAFVLKAKQPVLVDTGLVPDHDEFMANLRSVIDPADLKWLYLTHPDADHIGSLDTLISEAPDLKLVTTFLGYGILSLTRQIPLDRIYLLNPGESLDVGDRKLTVVKPPTFDNPATTGFYDSKSGALFSSDCFGGLVQDPADVADAMDPAALRQAQLTWTTIDAPWLHNVDRTRYAAQLNVFRAMEPSVLLSSHLPPAYKLTDILLANLADVPDADPFIGPNQPALEAMLAAMTQTPAPEMAGVA